MTFALSRNLTLAFGICTMLAGCASREHIRPDFGVKTHQFLRAQWVYAAPLPRAQSGLDSEEAATIHKSYREQLGLRGGSVAPAGQPLLLVGPPRHDQEIK